GLTALAWVKPDAATCPGTRAIASRGSEFSIWLDCKPDNSAATLRAFAHTTTGDHWTAGVGTIPFGQWSHVAVTWDKARARSFVNGALLGDEGFGGLVQPTSSWVSVGCWPPIPANNFKG